MDLPSYLFWDIELDSLDFEENARFIIQRVIERGNLNEWKTIKQYYGVSKIKKEILLMRNLEEKTLSFFAAYFNLNKAEFRCYTMQQSIQKHYDS